MTAVTTDPAGRVLASLGPPASSGGTIVVSRDGGTSWIALQGGATDRFVVARGGMAVSPAGRLYVRSERREMIAGTNGFGYTDDGGASWFFMWQIRGPDSFAADPFDKAVLYAVRPFIYGPPRPSYDLAKSTDGGVTFEPWTSIEESPRELAVSADGSRFWLASNGRHLWQSRDAGATWRIIADLPFADPIQLAISPRDPRILYAADGDGYLWVFREPDE